MLSKNYTTARKELAKLIDSVIADSEPVIITKGKHATAVLMSMEDYSALEETAFLLRNPKNAKRLLESIEDIKKGNVTTMTMEALEAMVK